VFMVTTDRTVRLGSVAARPQTARAEYSTDSNTERDHGLARPSESDVGLAGPGDTAHGRAPRRVTRARARNRTARRGPETLTGDATTVG